MERRARGFSPARSRSMGRCLARVAAATLLYAQRRPMVACLGGPPGEVRGKEASWQLSDGERWG
jgi:hypothetical protein